MIPVIINLLKKKRDSIVLSHCKKSVKLNLIINYVTAPKSVCNEARPTNIFARSSPYEVIINFNLSRIFKTVKKYIILILRATF